MTTQKTTNPFWFRQNTPNLFQVTNAPMNQALGILNISLRPCSQAQIAYGMIYNGLLGTAVGTVSFQVRVSKAGAPYVSTKSEEVGVNPDGTKRYWDHIVLNAPAKAQILRHMEAVRGGLYQVAAPAPVVQPVVTQQPMVAEQTYVSAVQNQVTQGAAVDYAAHVPAYSAPATQQMEQQPDYSPVAEQQYNELVTAGTGVQVSDDDLPF